MSAVATVLGLLLVVVFISSFILQQLPDEMAQLEFDHVNQVQNQLSQLQSTILTLGESPSYHLNLVTPVTLGSNSVPPFSNPSTGTIQAEPPSVKSSAWLGLGTYTVNSPNWNQGSNACASGTSGTTCTGNGNTYFYNFTGSNHTTLTIKVSGSNDGLYYNFTGNNDTINIQWTGGNTTNINVVVNGSYNTVNYVKSGIDVGNPVVNFLFFGIHDKFTFTPTGSRSAPGGMHLGVSFFGERGLTCPYGNDSKTDTVGALATGGADINMTVTWWNSFGYTTPVNLVAYPGGTIPTTTIRWSNASAGFVPCAFTRVSTSGYQASYTGGLDVHLFNRYSPQADLVYESGAVILAQAGGSALMVSPPQISVTTTQSGIVGSITLISLVSNFTAEGGIQTAGISTTVSQVTNTTLTNGYAQSVIASPFYYNVSTEYPSAWISFMNGAPSIFPTGASCFARGSLPAPYTCANPPPGIAVTISGALYVQSLTITTITVQLAIV